MNIVAADMDVLDTPVSEPLEELTWDQRQALDEECDREKRWLSVFQSAFGHRPFLLETRNDRGDKVGHLALCLVQSRLFGRMLVSLPYLNTAGVRTPIDAVAQALIDRAVILADELNADRLELRHERAYESSHFNGCLGEKVHMRLPLAADTETAWTDLKAKVRNQVRKGDSHDLHIKWGREEQLRQFYRVFSENMRDLGTPVYSRGLFESIIEAFPESEFGVTYLGNKPVAAAYLHHDRLVTSVPSASCVRRYNQTNANMWMYWQLLSRAIERGAVAFDFGRSTIGEGTYKFKKQWGATPTPANWQFYRRSGNIDSTRPNNPKFSRAIRTWKKLPLWAANLIGPRIVRGIP